MDNWRRRGETERSSKSSNYCWIAKWEVTQATDNKMQGREWKEEAKPLLLLITDHRRRWDQSIRSDGGDDDDEEISLLLLKKQQGRRIKRREEGRKENDAQFL